jgi:hypothetical protein
MLFSETYYNNYHGHTTSDLQQVYDGLLQQDPKRNFIYLAGDSSLDNKYWLGGQTVDACNGYEKLFNKMVPDVCYHLNRALVGKRYAAINCAVEESTIRARDGGLLAQDQFIRDHITENDILIVSLGGNDIALSPSIKTIWNMVVLLGINKVETIKKGPEHTWGMKHFIDLFGDGIRNYILRVIGDKRPKKIMVCMIYFPDEKKTGSWADKTLGYLGYNDNPTALQEMIKSVFVHATSKITIPGSIVCPVPIFSVMNGKNSDDYVQRVEPSWEGGRKMAKLFAKSI